MYFCTTGVGTLQAGLAARDPQLHGPRSHHQESRFVTTLQYDWDFSADGPQVWYVEDTVYAGPLSLSAGVTGSCRDRKGCGER